MWIIPFSHPELLTMYPVYKEVPLYIFVLLFLASITQFCLGKYFYRGALKALKNWSSNMDTLVVMGTTAAWSYGVILIMKGYSDNRPDDFQFAVHEHAHNFEISSTLITVITFGKFLEALTKKQTVDRLSDLASLKVTKAQLVREADSKADGAVSIGCSSREIQIDLLVVGDIVKVTNG